MSEKLYQSISEGVTTLEFTQQKAQICTIYTFKDQDRTTKLFTKHFSLMRFFLLSPALTLPCQNKLFPRQKVKRLHTITSKEPSKKRQTPRSWKK